MLLDNDLKSSTQIKKYVEEKQIKHKHFYHRKTRFRKDVFKKKQPVLIKRNLDDKKWEEGTINSKFKRRPRSQRIITNSGNVIDRNRRFITVVPKSESNDNEINNKNNSNEGTHF